MAHYKYLIVGGGMTAHAAARGIREMDESGSVGIFSAEPERPYKRPPLSKKLWQGKPLESVWAKMETESLGVEMHLSTRVRSLDPAGKRVMDEHGDAHTFDRLLLATGGRPKKLPFGDGQVIYFRTLDDYRHLRALAGQEARFAVIGGGFIGAEIAAALATNGNGVTLVTPGAGIGDHIYPPDLVHFLNGYYRENGVEVIPRDRVVGLDAHRDGVVLRTQGGRTVRALGAVAGIGIEPNVELARQAGLELANGTGGMAVDELLRTAHPDIFAAGDVAAFCDPLVGERRRVEHEDNANTMGRAAGRNMAGAAEPYRHSPFFYSDMFDLGYEAVGVLDPKLETVADWKEPYREGVVYYLHDGRVRGVLLWNVWGQVEAARRLIAEPGPFTPGDLKGRLPEANAQ